MRVATVTFNPALDLTVRADGLRLDAVNLGQGLRWNAGGKGVNVASALADHGVEVVATGLLGDANPERFEALFRRKRITDAFVRLPGATRVGVKLVDEAARQTTDINLPGLSPTPAELAELRRRIAELVPACGWFVLSGSLPPGVDPGIYAELVRELRAAGRLVAVDTSGPGLAAVLAAGPTLVKPNLHELEQALGRTFGDDDRALLAVTRELLGGGIALVALSMGERGALFATADEAWFARPPWVDVQSTVGAGDAMVAGLVAARIAGLPLADAARTATAFSVARLGGREPTPSVIEGLAPQVTLARAD